MPLVPDWRKGGGQDVLGFLRKRMACAGDGEIELFLAQQNVRDAACGVDDGYVFDIHLCRGGRYAGYVSLRIGESPALYYLGHIGYRVEEACRGHGYAARAVRLLGPWFSQHRLRTVVITNNPENGPSRATCLKLGCILESIVPVPQAYREVCMGAQEKCRYILYTDTLAGNLQKKGGAP